MLDRVAAQERSHVHHPGELPGEVSRLESDNPFVSGALVDPDDVVGVAHVDVRRVGLIATGGRLFEGAELPVEAGVPDGVRVNALGRVAGVGLAAWPRGTGVRGFGHGVGGHFDPTAGGHGGYRSRQNERASMELIHRDSPTSSVRPDRPQRLPLMQFHCIYKVLLQGDRRRGRVSW